MYSSTLFLLVVAAASLGQATECLVAVKPCVSSVNLVTCGLDSTRFPDPCGCSLASKVLQCWTSLCTDATQLSYANAAYSQVCEGTTVYGNIGGSTAINGIPTSSSSAIASTTATAAAGTTGTNTLATVTTPAATGTAVMGGVTMAPASGSGSGSGSGSSAGTGGSAAPASTSKAWGERSLVVPASGVVAAVLGLAILL